MKSDRDEFPRHIKEEAWKRCRGHCEHPACRQKIMSGANYDHITPAAIGGKATLENCQVFCGRCHRIKTSERDVPMIAKAKRIESKRAQFTTRRSAFREKADYFRKMRTQANEQDR